MVHDQEYPDVLSGMIARAKYRVWASLFIVDINPQGDPGLRVLNIFHELSAARWRGVDVRLVISGSRDNLAIAEATASAVLLAEQFKIPTTWLAAVPRRGSHSKFVIADDEVLLGSQNWSPSAFLASTQDSVWSESAALAAYLGGIFAEQVLRPRKVKTP